MSPASSASGLFNWMISLGPKNTSQYHWTNHAKFKMRSYGLSAQKILGVIRRPVRKEEGVVKNTTAVMQPINPKVIDGKKVWKQEIWAMYARKVKNQNSNVKSAIKKSKLENYERNKQIKIISAWRYPGVSPKNNPIPEDIIRELGSME